MNSLGCLAILLVGGQEKFAINHYRSGKRLFFSLNSLDRVRLSAGLGLPTHNQSQWLDLLIN